MSNSVAKDALSRLKSTDGSLTSVLNVLIPGDSTATKRLRQAVSAVCSDPMARGVLLLGNVGAGKSTVARAVALGRYFYFLTPTRVKEFLHGVSFDGPFRVSSRSLPWLVEMPLHGIVASLANYQLFGIVKATEAEPRPSIFEMASTGRTISDPRARPHDGALATGGVVFLDEIADLDISLQSKLLAVLTGAEVYRVGGEGDPKAAFSFKGLTIGATWQDVSNPNVLRHDLRSRLSDHLVHVPSLNERPDEIESIAGWMLEEISREYEDRLRDLQEGKNIRGLDLDRIVASRPQRVELGAPGIRVLQEADWTIRGELRGLYQVLREAARSPEPISEILERHTLPSKDAFPDIAEDIFAHLLSDAPAKEESLISVMNRVEGRGREALAAMLRNDRAKLIRVAEHLGCDANQIIRSLSDLTRSRSGVRRRPSGE